ncbi:ArsR/SmtB family transcription factor [Streptomyces sp. NPDC060000]|uniref:ArsR/SmtB family transcription factor n=1 Tax=Streptomyces sp. NPDC060000 TaxID=3347031 RepID=UPI0036B27C59
MQVPLYQAKAEFFRMLGHPVRIRVLELLQGGPVPVRDLLAEIEIEPSSLSQQLAVLRRSGIVVSIREGATVSYALAGGDVAELLRAARRILTELLAGQNELLAELRQADPPLPVPRAAPHGHDGTGVSAFRFPSGTS